MAITILHNNDKLPSSYKALPWQQGKIKSHSTTCSALRRFVSARAIAADSLLSLLPSIDKLLVTSCPLADVTVEGVAGVAGVLELGERGTEGIESADRECVSPPGWGTAIWCPGDPCEEFACISGINPGAAWADNLDLIMPARKYQHQSECVHAFKILMPWVQQDSSFVLDFLQLSIVAILTIGNLQQNPSNHFCNIFHKIINWTTCTLHYRQYFPWDITWWQGGCCCIMTS